MFVRVNEACNMSNRETKRKGMSLHWQRQTQTAVSVNTCVYECEQGKEQVGLQCLLKTPREAGRKRKGG